MKNLKYGMVPGKARTTFFAPQKTLAPFFESSCLRVNLYVFLMIRQVWTWFVLSAWVILPGNVVAQDSTRLPVYSHYKETVLTLGYNLNLGDEVNGVRKPALHFVELGVWKSSVFMGHHPFTATYYVANDFGLNTDNFVIGPKVGGFISILVIGFGGELTYYTDFHSGSVRLLPYFGYCTPFFKLTVSPHVVLTNREFQNLNSVNINLTIRVLKIKRTDLNN